VLQGVPVRRSPRALFAWLAAVLVAFGTARVVASDLATLHRRAEELGRVHTIVVAARDLPLGASVAPADVTTAQLAGAVPERALTDADDAVGRTVAVPLVADAPVLAGNLAPRDRTGLDGLVPPNMRAVRIDADDGLVPEPGEVVDVLATFDPSIVVGGGEPTLAVARAALVVRVHHADDGSGFPAAGGAGITLLVTDDEAHRLAFAAANGVLTVALAPPEDACCKRSSSGSSKD
jgi:Flp pilus assembly protein CpaB